MPYRVTAVTAYTIGRRRHADDRQLDCDQPHRPLEHEFALVSLESMLVS